MALHGSIGVSAKNATRATSSPRRPRLLWPLLVGMTFLSIGGFVGGVSFVADRTGRGLGAEPSWLDGTPVHDFLLPGLFLLGVYGIGVAVLIAGLLWRRPDRHLRGYHWSWLGTIAVGGILVAWIAYELLILEDTIALQPILIGVGLAMIAIPLSPSMREAYVAPRSGANGRR